MEVVGRQIILQILLLFYGCRLATCLETDAPQLYSILSNAADSYRDGSETLVLYANLDQKITLVGRNLTNNSKITFTTNPANHPGSSCDDFDKTDTHMVAIPDEGIDGHYGYLTINLPPHTGHDYYYICTNDVDDKMWIHQGVDTFVRFTVRVKEEETTLLPMPLQATLIVLLLILSGLFSGLNLGLMALDKTELKIIEKVGSKAEKGYAKKISPLRKRGNFLLCTLLLGNVLVNNTLTIMLDDLSNGLFAVIGATLGIVIFGEIIPQALCSRHGLAVGARTIWVTRFFMIVTFPLSFPISLLLDKILGEEIGNVYDREKLQELVRVTKDNTDLHKEEADIIEGALELTRKTVSNIMTRIEDVYMLETHSILDFETVSEIMRRGYTRIPVYDTNRSNINALFNTKDLALIDPDDKTSLQTVIKFYQHPLLFVWEDQKLDKMLQDFRQGHSHMAIVRRVNNEGEGDPFYENLGVVTLEDIIEEILQREIIDETDTLTDNINKAPRKLNRQDFSIFNQPDDHNRPLISPQLSLAAFRFLSTSVEAFSNELISEHVLNRLMKQNIIEMITPDPHKEGGREESGMIYKMNVPCDFFVLILQGQVEVYIGQEALCFSGGPFSFYGFKALDVHDSMVQPFNYSDDSKLEHYIPDFSVKATNSVVFMRIRRDHYIAARRATLMGRSKYRMSNAEDETFNREWNKISKVTDSGSNLTNEELVDIIVNNSALSNSKRSLNSTGGDRNSLVLDGCKLNTSSQSLSKPSEVKVIITNGEEELAANTTGDTEAEHEAVENMIDEEGKHHISGEQDSLLSKKS